MKKGVFILVVLCLASLAIGQNLGNRMTNQDVLDMVSLGLGEDVITAKIFSAQATEFDTSINALKTLKEAKVPDAVIKAMVNPKPAVAAANAAVAAEDPNLPPREVGMYWRDKAKFVPIDGQIVGQAKVGGRFASHMSMGITSKKWNAYVNGGTSKVMVKEARPVFYVYVPEGSSPNDYQLVKLDKKGDHRQFEVGSVGGLVGGKSGLRDENMVQVDAERVAPRTFKLTLKSDLKPGEYGFFQAMGQNYASNGKGEMGGNANGRIYDFSIPE